jgi:hypothetical protein
MSVSLGEAGSQNTPTCISFHSSIPAQHNWILGNQIMLIIRPALVFTFRRSGSIVQDLGCTLLQHGMLSIVVGAQSQRWNG